MISKGDFVEIEFTGKVKGGGVFDTNKEEVAKKENLPSTKPSIICIGYGMVVLGFDKALEGKEIGKEYNIELQPQEAFGERNPALVKIMPLKVFHQHNLNLQPGMSFLLDNYLVRISAVSGGRVTVDFNNPLSGKTIMYEFTIKRKIDSLDEKVKALAQFFFRTEIPFTFEREKIIFHLDKNKPEEANQTSLVEMMREKFKEMLKLEIEVKPKSSEENKESARKENQEEKKIEK